jgi:hypothetical protein
MSPSQQSDRQGSRVGFPVSQQDQEDHDADYAVEVCHAALLVGRGPAVQQCLEIVKANDTVAGQVGR